METTPETTKPVAAKPPVKRVKRKAKPAAKKAKPKAAKKPALKKSRKPKASLKHPESKHVAKAPGIQNKAEFIRSLPKDMPAKEVVRLAKLRGTQLTESYVYNTRGLAKLGKGGAKRVRVPSSPSHVLVAAVGGGGGGENGQAKPLTVEELFYAVVAEIGTVKAVHMLMAAHDTVKRALSGVPVT